MDSRLLWGQSVACYGGEPIAKWLILLGGRSQLMRQPTQNVGIRISRDFVPHKPRLVAKSFAGSFGLAHEAKVLTYKSIERKLDAMT